MSRFTAGFVLLLFRNFIMCLYPKLIENPKYRVSKKNGGDVPLMKDKRVGMVPIGCRKCIECRQKKGREWRVRLLEEIRHDNDGIFVTLTFSNESIKRLMWQIEKNDGVLGEGYDLDNSIATKAVHYFLERWRDQHKPRKSVKHWLVTELGHEGTENIHLHGIVWSRDTEAIKRAWKYGFIYFGYSFNEQGINYFTKYFSKVDKEHKYYLPKVFCSSGIGSGYMDRFDSRRNLFNVVAGETDESYTDRAGIKQLIPIYYRNKLYNEEQREILWCEKLDRLERFVLGSRIDISEGYEVYFRVLKDARSKNRRLGFGDDSVDWKQRDYENKLRKINVDKRIGNVDLSTGECL